MDWQDLLVYSHTTKIIWQPSLEQVHLCEFWKIEDCETWGEPSTQAGPFEKAGLLQMAKLRTHGPDHRLENISPHLAPLNLWLLSATIWEWSCSSRDLGGDTPICSHGGRPEELVLAVVPKAVLWLSCSPFNYSPCPVLPVHRSTQCPKKTSQVLDGSHTNPHAWYQAHHMQTKLQNSTLGPALQIKILKASQFSHKPAMTENHLIPS